MSRLSAIEKLEKDQLKEEIPAFAVGDTVRVHFRLIEGEKERIQVFTGTVIARKGTGLSETVSLYRVAYGEAMERVFLLHSPKVAKIEVVKQGKVRRSKLYYLRGTQGKAAKVKGRIYTKAKEVKAEIPTIDVEMIEERSEREAELEPASKSSQSE